jgi:rfaE bifunctional protein nucleotidyltransferase chain/domain
LPRNIDSKIWSPDTVRERCRQLHAEGRVLVFTNGCFDVLHAGHVRYLAEARKLGDVLIVGVNSDGSVRMLKGPERPFMPIEDRLAMLAALESVDAVTWFEEMTPDELIRTVRPDVHAKGGDYRPDEIPEAGLVRELGGKVVVLRLVEGRSTTGLLARLREVLLRESD